MESFHVAKITFRLHLTHRSSERCYPLKHSLGGWGARKDLMSGRTVPFQPSCLLPLWAKRACLWLFSENVRRAIWWRLGVFSTYMALTFPKAALGHRCQWSKNWEMRILWASHWLCLNCPLLADSTTLLSHRNNDAPPITLLRWVCGNYHLWVLQAL